MREMLIKKRPASTVDPTPARNTKRHGARPARKAKLARTTGAGSGSGSSAAASALAPASSGVGAGALAGVGSGVGDVLATALTGGAGSPTGAAAGAQLTMTQQTLQRSMTWQS